jgi:hypothetical protein
MASEGGKVFLSNPVYFSSLDNFENPATGLFILSIICNYLQDTFFSGFIPIKLCSLKRSLKFCFQYLTEKWDVIVIFH